MKTKYLIPILFFTLLAFLTTNISAQGSGKNAKKYLSINPCDLFVNGEYATYHDQRKDMNMFRAYWVFIVEGDTLLFSIRNIDLDTKEEKYYVAEVGVDSTGKLEILEVAGYQKNDAPQFTQSYIDLLNFIDLKRGHLKSFKKKGIIKDKKENDTQLFEVSPHYPLFQFRTIALQSDKKVRYKLLTAGTLKYEERNTFEKIIPLQNINLIAGPELTIEKHPSKIKKLHNYTVTLDDRWAFNDSLGNPGYWLSEASKRDAQIMLERVDWNVLKKAGFNDIPSFLKIFLYYSANGATVIMDSLEVKSKRGEYKVSYNVYDSNNHITHYFLKFWTKGDSLYVLNFSSFLKIYNENQAYFDRILKSVK